MQSTNYFYFHYRETKWSTICHLERGGSNLSSASGESSKICKDRQRSVLLIPAIQPQFCFTGSVSNLIVDWEEDIGYLGCFFISLFDVDFSSSRIQGFKMGRTRSSLSLAILLFVVLFHYGFSGPDTVPAFLWSPHYLGYVFWGVSFSPLVLTLRIEF